ncbi:hypothetical protein O181_098272 [Austropuccinia psidii MF-1]|uniref:Uncharacterized protein n=1 Tax=Austropuccinia psidii MF-1 TaxID=1389203 RepID=A0A9Q3JAX0_9BASI|nr:hypothetical protein [Austropuccinia psidii MF-1]
MLLQIHQGVMSSWNIQKKVPQSGGNSDILQWMESTIIQTSNTKKEYHAKNREASKEEAPVVLPSSLKSSNLPKKGRRTRKRIEGNNIPQVAGFGKSKKCHGQCLQHGQNIDSIQGKRGQIIRQPHFSKK